MMASKSSPPAYQPFYDRQAGAVLGYLRSMLDLGDADDCFQDTFLAALRAWDGFDGSNERAWVLTIARRKAIDRRRRESGSSPLAPETLAAAAHGRSHQAPSAEQRVMERERAASVRAAVTRLPEKQAAATVLRYRLDLPYREIGEVIGCSEAAARQNVRQALGRLRETIGEERHE